MIDEYWTWQFYGYHSYELSYGSSKPIVARCDDCCQYRAIRNGAYHDFCYKCSNKTEHLTDETRCRKSEAQLGHVVTEATRKKISDKNKGVPPTEEWKRKIRYHYLTEKAHNCGKPMSDEQKRQISATKQGVSIDEWTGFTTYSKYCEKFDEVIRDEVRKKHDWKCFVCDMTQEDNMRKLNVHHVDKNRDQGCNGHDWKLVPLCNVCHGKSHFDPMESRILYLLRGE